MELKQLEARQAFDEPISQEFELSSTQVSSQGKRILSPKFLPEVGLSQTKKCDVTCHWQKAIASPINPLKLALF